MHSTRLPRLRGCLMAVALAAVASFAAPASADNADKEKTKVTIKKLTRSGASGKLTSKDSSCLGRRKVSLFRFDDYVSVKVKTTRSSSNGRWAVKKRNLKAGRYFAKVAANERNGVTCLYDASKSERLG